jgi:hypothetical protein
MSQEQFARRIYDAMKARGMEVPSRSGEIYPVAVEDCHPDGRYNAINLTDKDRYGDARLLLDWHDGKPRLRGAWYCTTQPGPRLRDNPINPLGAAIIELGQTGAVYKLDTHGGSRPHRGLCQRLGAVTVARDQNKDSSREGDKRTTGNWGINWHDSGQGDHVDPATAKIGGASAGCNVTPRIGDQKAFVFQLETDPRWVANHNFGWRTTTMAYEWLSPATGVVAPPPSVPSVSSGVPISAAAVDLIVTKEVTSKSNYERRLRKPEWPGGASGVTVGIGYDVGAGVSSKAQLQSDWAGRIPQAMIDALVPAIGVTGAAAQALTATLQDKVDVPWDVAMAVFEKVTLPKYYVMTARPLANFDKLSPDCKGALVSLVYNRGASFSKAGDRYKEMRAIKAHMAAQEFAKIPAEFRSMKRLWPAANQRGLPIRREEEAVLFALGLSRPSVPAPTTVPPIVKDVPKVIILTAPVVWSFWNTIAANPVTSVFIVLALVAVCFGALRWWRGRSAG